MLFKKIKIIESGKIIAINMNNVVFVDRIDLNENEFAFKLTLVNGEELIVEDLENTFKYIVF